MSIPHRGLLAELATILLCVSSGASATTYRVPEDVPTIQGALNLTVPGDTVLVSRGTYPENLTMRSGVTLSGEQGAFVTVVDGQLRESVMRCENVNSFIVQDLTFRRGYAFFPPGGAGVAMDLARGDFRRCIFADNQSDRDGGGLALVESQSRVIDCTFLNNSASGQRDGGGIYCFNSALQVEDCFFVDNSAHEGGGIAVLTSSAATIRHSIFADNEATSDGLAGSAVIGASSSMTVESNTFVDNVTVFAGATVAIFANTAIFERNIIANAAGLGITCQGGGSIILSCNDVWNSKNVDYHGCPADPSNQSADPLFCNLAELDLTLAESSPCAPANSPPGCDLIGARDVACGPVTVSAVTWGQVKSRYGESSSKAAAGADAGH